MPEEHVSKEASRLRRHAASLRRQAVKAQQGEAKALLAQAEAEEKAAETAEKKALALLPDRTGEVRKPKPRRPKRGCPAHGRDGLLYGGVELGWKCLLCTWSQGQVAEEKKRAKEARKQGKGRKG